MIDIEMHITKSVDKVTYTQVANLRYHHGEQSVGSYIEGMFLATQVIDNYPNDMLPEDTRNLVLQPLVRVIIEQEQPLLDVIALMKDLPEDEIIDHMIAELSVLRILYAEDLQLIEEQIDNNTGDFQLKPEMLKNIIVEVNRIRTDIVEVEK